MPRTMHGQFQSQAAVTRGTATIRVAASGTVLQLDGFTTGAGDDLRLMLSPGILAPDSTGQPGLSSSTLIELGPLSGSPQQRIDIDARMWSAMAVPVRSVVVYNYADKTAYATANLS
ncbi:MULTISPECIES: DM13 domain-containing protein [unclassified Pseudarthrobacter]|uniref:DM13 domain-containing protein n=1 Tax=unclassified Pseudarthrobacter TaxID=2647000 RepID=UPI0036366C0F